MTTHRTSHKFGSASFETVTRASWLPIALILLAAAGLFFFQLGSEGLWIDEFFSIRDATTYSNDFAEGYRTTRLRPLYFMLLSFWMSFGSGDVWLRLPSVFAGIISVFLIYRLGRRLSGEKAGLISAALLATSPLFINHTQEVRMYVLSTCLGLAGTLFLTDVLLTDQTTSVSQKSFAGWALFRLLALFTVPLNLMLLPADAALLFWRFRRDPASLITAGKWMLLVVVLWSPTVFTALQETASSSDYAEERLRFSSRPGLGNLVYPLKFWMVRPFVTYRGPVAHFGYKLFTLVIAGLIGAGLFHKRKSKSLSWAVVWFVLPLLPIIGCSLFAAQLWEPRYVLFVSPYLFILMAAGFTRLWKDWKKAAIVFTLLYVVGVGYALFDYYDGQKRSDYKFNIETIEQYEQPGDAVVWGYQWDNALAHYYDGSSNIYKISGYGVETAEDVEQWMSQFPQDYTRIWWVIEYTKRIEGGVEEVVTENYNIEQSFDYEHNSSIFLLTPKTPTASAAASK